MNSAVETFLSFWAQFRPESPPYFHPADAGIIDQSGFELALLPVPVVGDLRSAECVVLMLNPGLDAEDIRWEQRQAFRDALLRNLGQAFSPDQHPHFYLDPAFANHPGAGYWARSRRLSGKRDKQKLREVIEAIATRDQVTVPAAQAHVARKVAVLQLCPYHSGTMRRRSLLERLPSTKHARALLDGLVAERSKLVVATRSVEMWGFSSPDQTDRLVVYPSSLGASASLTLASAGGRAMLKTLSQAPK